jgi:hypothetical protein
VGGVKSGAAVCVYSREGGRSIIEDRKVGLGREREREEREKARKGGEGGGDTWALCGESDRVSTCIDTILQASPN